MFLGVARENSRDFANEHNVREAVENTSSSFIALFKMLDIL